MIIVEDGTGVPGANSYVSLEYVRSFASIRGVDLPEDDTELSYLIINSFDYIETFEFKGRKKELDQATQWPRSGVVIDGFVLPDDSIPDSLKKAQSQASVETLSGDLMPNPSLAIKKEKVDVLEVEYQVAAPEGVEPSFPKVDAFLRDLLTSGGSGLRVRVKRA